VPEDKKDVATKLSKRMSELLTMFSDITDSADKNRDRLGVYTEDGEGMAALRVLFERQIKSQFEAHGLTPAQFYPVNKDQIMDWNAPWMRYMTMWLDAMIDETEETRNWLNWKCWKKPVPISENAIVNARLELIDLLHFWLNAYYMLGGTPETLVVEYHAKRDENDARQKEGY